MSDKEHVDVAADVAATEDKTQILCMVCNKDVQKKELVSSPKCSGEKYCSAVCLDQHENHTQYCPWICSLERLETEKRMKDEISMSDAEKLPYKMKLQLGGETPGEYSAKW